MSISSSCSSSSFSEPCCSSQELANDTDDSGATGVPRVFDRLRPPRLSDLTRKRKVAINAPPKGKRRACGRGSADPKSVTPKQRASEFSDEKIAVSNGQLFCLACREELSLKRSVISRHIKSKKHIEGKERLKVKEAREQDIAVALQKMDEDEHLKGETLPTDQRVFRVKVVRTFLRAGVPLNKLDLFRELLEEGGFRLTDRRHMSDVIPLIRQQELELLKTELAGKYISVIFDGTTRFGEAMAILVRFIDHEFCVQQRLIRMQLLAKSMTGEEVARELIACLSVSFSIGSEQLIGSMHDRASVNSVAMTTLKVVYPFLLDIGCFSHTLDHVGEKIVIPTLSDFATLWISLFSHSSKAKLAWKDQTNIAIKTHSTTRWWSKFEVMKQVFHLYGDVEVFLRQHPDISPATCAKLLALFDNPNKKILLELELATLVDAASPFVQATYKLEGDGPLIFKCYDIMSSLSAAVHVAHYPNVEAISRKHAQDNTSVKQQLEAYARQCMKPAYDYYNRHLSGCLKESLAAFKAAQLFVPQKVQEMQPDALAIDSLAAFPFLNSPSILDTLKQELPQYIAYSEDLSSDYDLLQWWKGKESTLPTWASCAQKVLCLQPSSAAAERVFSLLQTSFGDRQGLALQDYIETALMLQYNSR